MLKPNKNPNIPLDNSILPQEESNFIRRKMPLYLEYERIFIDLFEHNHYQNQTLLHPFETHQSRISDRCLDLFSHLILAHHIEQQDPGYPIEIRHMKNPFSWRT